MVGATAKISEYAVLIYIFQTGMEDQSILVKKYCFEAKVISILRRSYTTLRVYYSQFHHFRLDFKRDNDH